MGIYRCVQDKNGLWGWRNTVGSPRYVDCL
jgi:hypothetical protein